MQDVIDLLRQEFQTAHEWLRDTIADLTQEQAQWHPSGVANPIGATVGHVLLGEDAMIQISLKGGTPRFLADWQDKTGLSRLSPGPGEGDWDEWARTVEVDLPQLRSYGEAVQRALDEYLEGMDGAEFARAIDRPGLPGYTVGRYLATITLPHMIAHTGEIACLKGLQGARGYNN